MKSKIAVLLITVILLNSKSFSQASPGNYLKWGIETELIQPFLPNVGIIRFQVARTLSRTASKMKGDLLLGAYIRPNIKHDVVEKINEYLLITGYRQYLWKGLHLEAKSNIGYAWGTKNLIDGRDYNNFSWFWESNLGY